MNSFPNDGLPGFIADPTRGVTAEDLFAGRFPLPPQSPRVLAHDYKMPYTWQSIIGFQMQLRELWGFEADITHWKGYNFARMRDPNLFFNPATGYNLHPSQFGRPDPKFTRIQWMESNGRADSATLSAALTRRYRNNWQMSVAYTLGLFANDNTTGFQSEGNNAFDPEAEWARSTEFQRHTFRVNTIVRLPYDVSLSGAYFFGSGNYYSTSIAANPFGKTGVNRYVTAPLTVNASALDRFEGKATYAVGEVVPRNALKGFPLHRVDLRISKDINFPGGVKITGIAEVFNLFNHENYGAYNTLVNSAAFGNPVQNLLNAYQPRKGQLAFKVTF